MKQVRVVIRYVLEVNDGDERGWNQVGPHHASPESAMAAFEDEIGVDDTLDIPVPHELLADPPIMVADLLDDEPMPELPPIVPVTQQAVLW